MYVWPSPLNINLANCQNYAQFVSVDSSSKYRPRRINLTHCQNYVRLLGPMMMMMISRKREKESSTILYYLLSTKREIFRIICTSRAARGAGSMAVLYHTIVVVLSTIFLCFLSRARLEP
jgi:hypothetical protein